MKTPLSSPYLEELCLAPQREAEGSAASTAPSPWLQAFGSQDAEAAAVASDEAALSEEETGVIGDRDDRRPVADTTTAPFRWICSIAVQRRITRGSGGTSLTGLAPAGSGLLISPRHVLTAAHVLNGINTDDKGRPLGGTHEAQTVKVKFARDGSSEPFGEIEAKSWVTHPNWKPAEGSPTSDLALITLKEAVGERVFKAAGGALGWWGGPGAGATNLLDDVPAALLDSLIGTRVVTAGYPGSSKGAMVCAAGVLSAGSAAHDERLRRGGLIGRWARSTPLIWFTADATKGQSGSPLWLVHDGRRHLIGVVGQAGTDFNLALVINAAVLRQINHWLGRGAGQPQGEVEGQALPWESEEPPFGHEAVDEAEGVEPVFEALDPMSVEAMDESPAEAPMELESASALDAEATFDFDTEPAQDFDTPAELEDGEALDESVWTAAEALAIEEHDSAPPVREVVVGQRVVLDLANTSFAGKVASVQWEVPGRAVRGYDGNAHNAKLFELTDADKRSPRISFFWVDGENNRTVRARIRTSSGSEEIFSATFSVKRPVVGTFSATVGVTRKERRAGLLGMRLGKLVEAPGVKWNWKVTLPAGHAGSVKDVQTLLQDRTQELRLAPGAATTRTLIRRHPRQPQTPHLQLDGHDGNQAGYTPGLASVSIAAGDSFINNGSSDSPHTNLPSLGKVVTVNDQFSYFILFKPATAQAQDAIWVPLAKALWAWKATARNHGGRWTVSAPKMTPAIHKSTLDFPRYETNADENEWQEAP